MDSDKQTGKFLPTIIVSVIALLIIFGLFYYLNPTTKPPQSTVVKTSEEIKALEETLDTSKLGGVIYLTLKSKEPKKSVSGLFAYFLDNNELIETLGGNKMRFLAINEHMSPDNKISAYVVKVKKEEGVYISQVFTYTYDTWSALTSNNVTRKQHPKWSLDGTRIAYMAYNPETPTSTIELLPNKWSVYIVDMDGKETYVTDGAYPTWIPDGNLVVLKPDGLYLVNVEDNSKVLIWQFDSTTYINTMLNVSKDGTMIALSSIDNETVSLIKVSSWEPFNGELYAEIPVGAFWPVFSEDGKYLVVQAVDLETIKDNPDPRLIIYDVDTLRSATMINLDGYEQLYMFVTDWRDNYFWHKDQKSYLGIDN